MAQDPRPPRSILITGASSGIGEALALLYAKPGVFLALSGRNRSRLDAVADECLARGAVVQVATVDVCDRRAAAEWIWTMDDQDHLDLVIANAGISAGTGREEAADEQTCEILAVNLGGVINTVQPALQRMRDRGRGQIAIMSSIAGYRGLPSSPAYSASKVAVRAWGESLRALVAEDGVRINVIMPGFVTSRITDLNDFSMPFLMPAERAARIIRKGLARNKPRIAFPWPMVFGMWFLSVLPARLADAILVRLPRTPGSGLG